MKIGIMGGTFDPVHEGHIMLGQAAYRQFSLDEIWFLPNGNPPHKSNAFIKSDAIDRTAMVRLAIAGHPGFRLNEYEAQRTEVSYTCDTLAYFSKLYPKDDFYFIIGADSLLTIENWVHPERIFPLCTILAAYRDDMDTKEEMYRQMDHLKEKYHAEIELLATPLKHVSSSELRRLLKAGGDVTDMIPADVAEYIRTKQLYREEYDEAQDQPHTQKIKN